MDDISSTIKTLVRAFFILCIVGATSPTLLCGADTRHTNKNGYAGRSITRGNTTHHYHRNGSYAGRSTASGTHSRHYNSKGYIGRSVTKGNTTHHYNRNGSYSGRSTSKRPPTIK